MNKELEAFNRIMEVYGKTNSLEGTYDYFLTIKKALQHLESIDNADLDEALKCVNELWQDINVENDFRNDFKRLKIIEQSLLKAHQQKKYLKWEDLEFKPYTVKVKMGDNLYMLDWRYSNDDNNDNSKAVVLRTLNGDWLFTLEKYFFNDLHLEVIENE